MKEKGFAFGKNWLSFLKTVNEDRIKEAVYSLKGMLLVENLNGKKFLDIGCGSGLFSLAAFKLGAEVFSFDYDEESVACAMELKRKYCDLPEKWKIEKGSVLDLEYMSSLGKYDIVYSWGVLHHTGNMKKAIENAASAVSLGGILFISIYNDQGFISIFWREVKRIYCSSFLGKAIVTTLFVPTLFLRALLSGLLKHGSPLYHFLNYGKNRGMSIYHDWIDWLGGYPFETSSPSDIEKFLASMNFELKKSKLTYGLGCNEFVFIRKK